MTLNLIATLLMRERLASAAVLLQLERLFFIAFTLLLLSRLTSTECTLEINKNGGFKLVHVSMWNLVIQAIKAL